MLGYRGIAKAEEFGEVSDRPFAVNQLTDDQQPVAVGQGFQQITGRIGSRFHEVDVNICFHTCEYTGV